MDTQHFQARSTDILVSVLAATSLLLNHLPSRGIAFGEMATSRSWSWENTK